MVTDKTMLAQVESSYGFQAWAEMSYFPHKYSLRELKVFFLWG